MKGDVAQNIIKKVYEFEKIIKILSGIFVCFMFANFVNSNIVKICV